MRRGRSPECLPASDGKLSQEEALAPRPVSTGGNQLQGYGHLGTPPEGGPRFFPQGLSVPPRAGDTPRAVRCVSAL